MTAKEYLRQLIDLDNEIDILIEQIRWLRAQAEGLSVSYDDIPHGGGQRDLSDIVVDIVTLQEDCNRKTDKMVNLRREAIGLLSRLEDGKQRTLLQMRYLNRKSWKTIADLMVYSKQHIYRLHGQALANFDKILKDESSMRVQ